jgi:hypothetical protein
MSLSLQLAWLPSLVEERLGRLLGAHTLDIALGSDLEYVIPPRRWENTVQATVGKDRSKLPDGARPDVISVSIELAPDLASLHSTCSRCLQSFGPCPHAAVLAVDLALSRELREAVLRGADCKALAARAPNLRQRGHFERVFEADLDAWLRPTSRGTAVDISVAVDQLDGFVRYGYGSRLDPTATHVLAVTVRRRGERKLCALRDLTPRTALLARDRRALEHAKDMRTGKKALIAMGVDASLTLEAMRRHGGVFANGFKRRLDFKNERVRPHIVLVTPPAERDRGDRLDELSATWVTDGGTPFPFADSYFFPGPFPYVWSGQGDLYPVAPDVDLELAAALAARPILRVPSGRLSSVGARLFRGAHGHGVVLPARDAFGLPALDTPRFVLRLLGEPLDFQGELVAVYREREVVLAGKRREPSLPDHTRDAESEQRATEAIVRAGLMDASDAREAREAREGLLALEDEAAIAFWQRGLTDLRSETDPPIEVVLSETLARVRVGAPLESRIRVSLEGSWLDTRIEFASGELGVELATIREALAQKRRWVRLSDGSLSRISASIAGLSDEVALVMKGESRALLPAHQLGRIDRWLEENDGRVDAHVEALRVRLRALAVSAEPVMPVGLEATLRPYQRRGLAWLQFLQALGAGGILADDMGLGKTITTLAFLLQRKEHEGPAPTLVVCPTSVVGNWAREAARFTPGLSVLLFHGATRKKDYDRIANADVVVTTYALLRRDREKLAAIPFRIVVLDEAQNIKNADAATTRAAGHLNASMRLALSGTPMENRLAELWSLASFANPGILGTLRSFETHFERPIVADRESPVASELRALVRPFLLRRTKDDVLSELPPKTEIDRFVTLGPHDKRMYDALAHALRVSVAKDIEKRKGQGSLSVFTALTRLRQMACDPRLVDPKSPPAASAKREAFLELVRELVLEGRRALVFSQFVQLLSLWRMDLDAEKIPYEYLDGSTVKRDEIVERFQAGTAPLFLISLKAGGAGLNLTAADTVIHCDPWWNPAVEDQATDRTHRIGQDKPVTVVRLVARGTIEEKILSLKAKKRDLARAVIDDDAGALAGLTAEDLARLLGDADADGDASAVVGEETWEPGTSALESSSREVTSPTDLLATGNEILSPEYHTLVTDAQRWLATTGRPGSDLARLVDLPAPYAARLSRGEPFPCSRAVATRIRERLRN